MFPYRTNFKKLIIYLLLYIAIYVVYLKHSYKSMVIPDDTPEHLHKYFKFGKMYPKSSHLNHWDLKQVMEKLCVERELRNWQKYGPVISSTPIIVIRVHRDLERLQYLVVSLAQVRGIERVLLIFSHSFYDKDINFLIQQIDFCMVIQLFYPNSLQLHPHKFSSRVHINNTYENDRYVENDARLAESKDHWWWSAQVVFEELAWTENHNDMVIFIAEDSYVLPDFLYMLKVSKISLTYVPDASVLSFGRSLASDLEYNKLTVAEWRPPYDKALAFNKTTWKKIVDMKTYYCSYDDTSWSYSLLHLFSKFPRESVMMVACMAPRVLSTSVFDSGNDAYKTILWMTHSERLFPKKVHAVILFGHDGRLSKNYKMPPRSNGGWLDVQDQAISCNDNLVTATEEDSTVTQPETADHNL